MDIAPENADARRRFRATLAIAMAVGAAAAVLGVAAIVRFVDQERLRDIANWQARLTVVADSRQAAVDGWIAEQWSALDAVAGNDSVRVFLTEWKLGAGSLGNLPDGASQRQYVENLLTFTAAQNHFQGPELEPNLPVNIARAATSGMAIFDPAGKLVIATRGTPVDEAWVAPLLGDAAKGKRALRDIAIDAAGNPAMGFAAPIFAVQGEATAADQVGWVLGIKQIASELYPLLRQPGDTTRSGKALLIGRSGDGLENLSPLPEYKPLSLRLANARPGLAESQAAAAPGGFGLARDYRGTEVLYASRAIQGAPWTLAYEIDRSEALGDSDRRTSRLLGVFLLALLLGAALLAAAWRHGASRRAVLAAERYRGLADRFERQSSLLRLVTDGQPNPIFITDDQGRYTFANRSAAAEAGISGAEMLGKALAAVLGPAKASRYVELNRRAAETGEPIEDVARSGQGKTVSVLHSKHIPLAPSLDRGRGVLVIEEDLSALSAEQERRRATLDRLVDCLISLADRRDPAATGHSAFVAVVAHDVAEEMALPPVLIETAAMAARLMNLGKILVPRTILTRAGPLSQAELDQLHNSLFEATHFLDGVEFDGPVIETLRQCQERWDGGGRPAGLKEREILPTARVLAAANAFVGLLSPRAYHVTRRTVDDVVEMLVAEIGRSFDPAVIGALLNRIENKGGRTAWSAHASSVGEPKPIVVDPA